MKSMIRVTIPVVFYINMIAIRIRAFQVNPLTKPKNTPRPMWAEVPSIVISPPFQVYIEDTDAYGVMYNANYLRAYERALQQTNGIVKANDWAVIRVEKHKFKSSPCLGGRYEVVCELKDKNDDVEQWNLIMRDVQCTSIVYNSALVTIGSMERHMPPCFPSHDGLSIENTFTPFRDEFEGCIIPIRNQLNFFERARSNFLGGPATLRKLHEDGLVFVVTSIDQGSLIDAPPYRHSHPKSVDVLVETKFVTKRKGMILECQHTLFSVDKANGERRRIGQAIVTIMTLNATTRRPTSDLPKWLQDMMALE